MQIVIIGGDAAGMSAASEARRRAPDAKIVVLEATSDVSYGACGLPYKMVDGANVEDLQVISAEKFRSERNLDVRLEHRVESFDTKAKVVRGTNPQGAFEVAYDRLVVATGARAIRPSIVGLDALWGKGAYTLKTLQDGRELKAALAVKPASAIVIGGGYIGLETTENLREAGLDVTLVEALPELIPFLPADARKRVLDEAAKHGVKVHVNTKVTAVSRTGERELSVETTQGIIKAEIVVVAVGVRPNSEIAKDAGLELGAAGSISTNAQLQTSAPDVFAAGDCADATHAITGKSAWIPLALRANRAGKLAGQNVLGGTQRVPAVMGTACFKFFGLQVARTGLSTSEAKAAGLDPVSANIVASTRAHYIPGGGKLSVELVADRASRKLIGASLVGPEGAAHKIDTVVACIHAGLTPDQLYEMDLAYAPPFGPSWSPLLVAASKLQQALKKGASAD